ncbi:MAG: hypothetical protein Q7T27_19680, partial [Pseudomonas sp.]|uniref:hypothetical protein n=1 Tax=Pseudomonas sp. TaxID=306 RepID=UPI002725E35C
GQKLPVKSTENKSVPFFFLAGWLTGLRVTRDGHVVAEGLLDAIRRRVLRSRQLPAGLFDQ